MVDVTLTDNFQNQSQSDDTYGTSVSQMIREMNTFQSFPHSWLITGFVTRVTRQVPLVEQELPTLPEHLSSPLGFSGVRVARSFVFCIIFCRSFFVLFFWPLSCLSFFDLRNLITPLVSSNSTYNIPWWDQRKNVLIKDKTEILLKMVLNIYHIIFIYKCKFYMFFLSTGSTTCGYFAIRPWTVNRT